MNEVWYCRAVVPNPRTNTEPWINCYRAAELQDVYWCWHHSLSGYAAAISDGLKWYFHFSYWKITTTIEYSRVRGKIAKRLPVRGYKKVGDHCCTALKRKNCSW